MNKGNLKNKFILSPTSTYNYKSTLSSIRYEYDKLSENNNKKKKEKEQEEIEVNDENYIKYEMNNDNLKFELHFPKEATGNDQTTLIEIKHILSYILQEYLKVAMLNNCN